MTAPVRKKKASFLFLHEGTAASFPMLRYKNNHSLPQHMPRDGFPRLQLGQQPDLTSYTPSELAVSLIDLGEYTQHLGTHC